MRPAADARHLVSGLAGIAALTLIFTAWTQISSPATVALSFLIVVLFVAATARLRVAVATSLVAMLALNFFFLPPVGTFAIADPQNWIACLRSWRSAWSRATCRRWRARARRKPSRAATSSDACST